MVRAARLTAFVALFGSLGALAQAPAFLVASIKENTLGGQKKAAGAVSTTGTGGVIEPPRGDTFRAQNATVRTLIRYAFGQIGSNGAIVRPLEIERLVGGPAWLDNAAFDIEARMDDSGREPVARMAMLRSLLEGRFALRAHREARDLPVYNLVLARADRRLGPQMRQLTEPCTPVIDPATRDAVPCAVRTGSGTLTGHGVALAAVATYLTPVAGRLVIDRTDLSGRFDVAVRFAVPVDSARSDGRSGEPLDAPSIFSAVQEQLGLRLEPARAPVDTLVIDHVERPTRN
jgi:uncharacterized protein (TIGR03435 family)